RKVSRRISSSRNLRRSRAHKGLVQAFRKGGLYGYRAEFILASGRRIAGRDETDYDHRRQSARYAGDVGFGRHGRVGEEKQRQYEKAFDYRLLLGRQNR